MRRMRIGIVLAALAAMLAVAAWLGRASTGAGVRADEPAEEALEEFVPSEKVPADTAVAFPVDI